MTGLDASRIRRSLMGHSATCLDRIEVLQRIDSTNSYLKDQSPPPVGKFRVVIAEHQTAGRGRHDRQWISFPGGSLCLSLAYRFQHTRPDLPALTLALGTGIAELLSAMGVAKVALKWPNDVMVGNSKLGGILTETLFRGQEDATVIAGVGLNFDRSASGKAIEGSAWAESATGLKQVMENPPSRERLSGVVIESLMSTFKQFEKHGFNAFAERFEAYDWLLNKVIDVATPEGPVGGIAAGISDDGALLVATNSGPREIYAGSIKQVGEQDTAQ